MPMYKIVSTQNTILADQQFMETVYPSDWELMDDVESVVPQPTIITKLMFMNRFTTDELTAIYTAAKTTILVEIWLEKFKLASEIDLNNPDTINGIQSLEAASLILAGRASEILTP
jgi:hypothetical protein